MWKIFLLVILCWTCQASPAGENPPSSNKTPSATTKPAKSEGWNILRTLKNLCIKTKDFFIGDDGILTNFCVTTGEKSKGSKTPRRCSCCGKPKKGQDCKEIHAMQQHPSLPVGQMYPPQGYHGTAYPYPLQYYAGQPYYPPPPPGAPYPPGYRPPPQHPPMQPHAQYRPSHGAASSGNSGRQSSGSSCFCCCVGDSDDSSGGCFDCFGSLCDD